MKQVNEIVHLYFCYKYKQSSKTFCSPRIYNKETVYKFSFLIGSGQQLDLFSSVGHSVHLSKNKSTLLSIPKSNSKIIYLSLFIILYYSLRRRIFFVVQGGFQICAAWRTDGTRANEIENNAVIRKKDKPKSEAYGRLPTHPHSPVQTSSTGQVRPVWLFLHRTRQ